MVMSIHFFLGENALGTMTQSEILAISTGF